MAGKAHEDPRCDCYYRQPEWNADHHAHYDECPTLQPEAPPPPPPPPPPAPPANGAPPAQQQATAPPQDGWKPLPKMPAGEGDFPPNLRFTLNMPHGAVTADQYGPDQQVTGWKATSIDCTLDNYQQKDTKNGSRWVLSLKDVAGIPDGKCDLWANTCLGWYCKEGMLRVGHKYRLVLARVGSNNYQDFDVYELG